jgi:hypothetical protein
MLCAMLAACKIDAKLLLDSEDTLTIETHQTNGTSNTKREIRKGDETYSRFKKWVEENEKGWEPSPVTFVPAIEVRGKKFAMNFHPTRAILNFQSTDGKYHQYVKEVKESDFKYLLPR